MVDKKIILWTFYFTFSCWKRLDLGTSFKKMDKIPKQILDEYLDFLQQSYLSSKT